VGIGGYIAWYNLLREVPLTYESPEDNFKYGSIGAENAEGFPYWIWLVLPRLFPEKLPEPGGYTSLGLIWEEGQEMPMGFTKKTIGFPRVALNCATCHITKVRTSPTQGKPTFYLGGPSQQLDGQAYQQFLFACARDPRFTADYILSEINKIHQFSWLENFLYRYIIIPQTKQTLLAQAPTWDWQKSRPRQGPGRVDPFNPVKFRLFHLPEDNTVGNADIPSIWNQKPRVGLKLHWNGLLSSFSEIAVNSAIGDGATRESLNYDTLKRVEDFMMELPPPQYPYPTDATLAAKGEKIFSQQCATCHALGAPRVGTVIPLAEIGTDSNRSEAWTQAEVDSWQAFAEGYPFSFETMVKEDGYVAVPLDGIWLRAPYLHNGSVPSLTALLEKPENRPRVFYRGYDVYNSERVGFVSEGAEAERVGFRYDTTLRGNSNQGHLYGIDLPSDDKKALVEYLKTL
jgi:mono/diheme cytochrome c family protein